jgi:quercetin dioxygenase-like cupin family protein
MRKKCLLSICAAWFVLAASVSSIPAQEKKENAASHKIERQQDLKWTPIMKGCDLAPVFGDPGAEGAEFVIRIRCADGTKIPAHWHPTDEHLTILKGSFLVGMGEKFDETKLQTLNPGDFILIPKEMRHFARAKGENLAQIHGIGPFKVNWVNPAEVVPPDAARAPESKP